MTRGGGRTMMDDVAAGEGGAPVRQVAGVPAQEELWPTARRPHRRGAAQAAAGLSAPVPQPLAAAAARRRAAHQDHLRPTAALLRSVTTPIGCRRPDDVTTGRAGWLGGVDR